MAQVTAVEFVELYDNFTANMDLVITSKQRIGRVIEDM